MASPVPSPLERVLLDGGLDPQELEWARHTARALDTSVAAALVVRGALSEDAIVEARSCAYGLPVWGGELDGEACHALGAKLLFRTRMAPVARRGRVLRVAAADPTDHDALAAVQFAAQADLEVEVASEQSIVGALITVFAHGEAAPPAAAPAPDGGQSPDPPVVRLANMLLLTLTRGRWTRMRIALGDAPELRAWDGARWVEAADAIAAIPPKLLPAVAERYAEMASIPGVSQPAWGLIALRAGTAWHGGRNVFFDVVIESTSRGPTVLVARSGVRAFGEDDAALLDALRRAGELLDQGRLAAANAELGAAHAEAIRVDGPRGALAAKVLALRGSALRREGRLEEALATLDEAAACRGGADFEALLARYDAVCACNDMGQHAAAGARAREACETLAVLFGAPGLLDAFFRFEMGRASLASGAHAEAEAIAAWLCAHGPALGGGAEARGRWLRGQAWLERGDTARAAPELRAVLGMLDEGQARVEAALALAACAEAGGRPEEARTMVELADDGTRCLGAAHPLRARVETLLARVSSTRPYR